MDLTDVGSLVHLLQTLSWYGMPFLMLIVLALLLFVCNKVLDVLKVNGKQQRYIYLISSIVVIASVMLLKVGINDDKETVARATTIKGISLQYNTDFIRIDDLIKHYKLPADTTYYDELIKRFPNSFSYGFLPEGKKAIVITDKETLERLYKAIDQIVPAIRSELLNILQVDYVISFDDLRNQYDSRMSYTVLESVIAKYPDEFQEIAVMKGNFPYSELKRIK